MNTIATFVLVFLGIVLLSNAFSGNLGRWLRAKFLNQATPAPRDAAPTPGKNFGANVLPPSSNPAVKR